MTIPSAAAADQIRVNGIWLPGVQILRVADGHMVYVTSAGQDVRRPYGEVTGLRLDNYPKVQEAFELLEKGEDQLAIRVFTAVRREVRGKDAWVGLEATRQIVAAHDRLSNGVAAATAYAELIEQGGGVTFATTPPVGSVSRLSDIDKLKVRQRLARTAGRTDAQTKPYLESLLAAAQPGATEPARPDGPRVSPPTPTGLPGAGVGPYKANGAVMLPQSLSRSELADKVFAGEFAAAITLAEEMMDSRMTSELMYLRAMARLGLAERSRGVGKFKDAGLDFMRVLVYYPQSPYAGPALLEVAYIHDRLQIEDQAQQLYEQAGRVLTPEDHPRYHARYLKLTQGR
ncbi:MAG: hypothetical protein AAF333_06150 [Planctomycetota bacterium]